MYEVLFSPYTNPAQTVTIGRYEDAQAANSAAQAEQSARPAGALYVFLWVTPSTRLLINHTLGGYRQ